MQLDDVLKVVGSSTLDAFPWGSSVVTLVNSFLPDDQVLTTASTGDQLTAAIASLSTEQQQTILTARISPIAGTVTPPVPVVPAVPAIVRYSGLLIGKDGKISVPAVMCMMTALVAVAMAISPTAVLNGLMTFDWAKLETIVTSISHIVGILTGSST